MGRAKHRYPCPMCDRAETRTLSDEAAVEIHEFLEVIAANFLSRYGERTYRPHTQQAKRHVNPDKPWLNSNELF